MLKQSFIGFMACMDDGRDPNIIIGEPVEYGICETNYEGVFVDMLKKELCFSDYAVKQMALIERDIELSDEDVDYIAYQVQQGKEIDLDDFKGE